MKDEVPGPSNLDKAVLNSQNILLVDAHKAASNHQPNRMLEALVMSGFLDGLIRQLDKRWDRLDRMEIEDCVARAVDEAYEAITQNRKISNLGAWLWKAANNKLNDIWRKDYSHRVTNLEDIEDLASTNERPLTEEEQEHRDELLQFQRDEAIRLARRLLPKIGKGQVVSVMEVVIDAVEHGVPDMSAAEIGDTLGITADAARSLLARGWKRLYRAAREAGVTLPTDVKDAEQ